MNWRVTMAQAAVADARVWFCLVLRRCTWQGWAAVIRMRTALRGFRSLDGLPLDIPNRCWGLADGRLDLQAVLQTSMAFWRENGEWIVRGQSWPESAQQIVLMAFLQTLVNGRGYIDREYRLGRKRLDLLIRWFTSVDATGLPLGEDRHALELKVWRDGQKDPLVKGLEQIDGYLERLGLAMGTLMLFDARATAPVGEDWENRGEFSESTTPAGRTVTVLRL